MLDDNGREVKKRILPWYIPGKIEYVIADSNGARIDLSSSPPGLIKGTQFTASEGHTWPPVKGSRADVGGNFFTQKKYCVQNSGLPVVRLKERYITGSHWAFYEGPLLPVNPNANWFPPDVHSTDAALDALGAVAVERCKPTNSPADVATALGELYKDGLPHLVGSSSWKSRTRSSKKLGDEYLNVQFGWAPLLNDVAKFCDAVSKSRTLLEQYERDAGKQVRRRYEFPLQVNEEETVISSATIPYGMSSTFINPFPYTGKVVRRRVTTKKQWFSGAFSYFLPTGYDARRKIDRLSTYADKILGITPDPGTLWNLAPWSWAIDWFSSTGAVISNLNDYATSGLVMRYGYIMEHSSVHDTYYMPQTGLKNSSVFVPPLTFVMETKIRRRANPFGFGLIWEGLSPFQLSIAAALGLSRR